LPTITARFTKRPRLSIASCDGVNPNQLQLLVRGEFGGKYLIEAGVVPAESGWEQRGILATPFGSAQYNEAIPRETSERIYRAVSQ
jgi:hypothetical protein